MLEQSVYKANDCRIRDALLDIVTLNPTHSCTLKPRRSAKPFNERGLANTRVS
jgi:hypothetical protein